MDDRKQMTDLCAEMGVTLTARHMGRKVDADKWEHDAWKVTLRFQGRQLTTDFRSGTGHGGKEPSPADVLASLILDADCGDRSFEDFCGDLGYDPDSRKAERIWKACKRTAPKVRRLLGEHFEAFQNAEH